MKQIPYYDRDIDFDDLAKRDPEFAAISQHGKRDGFIDFQDPKIVQHLTKSLLKVDFNLKLELPDDRLCPPVPVRWNYIRWIQDLLDTTSEDYTENFDPEREVVGMDIGVGASCIYALLACASRENWRMAGTDVDEHSLSHARRNVQLNGLEDRIRLKKVEDEDEILPLDALGIEELDFIMTNPPFYTDHADFLASYNPKDKSVPSAVCTGSTNEMISPGGDVGFVTRIVKQSLLLRERVQWYTAMLSKLSSLHQILSLLKQNDITSFAVTSLHPGRRTKRWAVGWSFGTLRPRNDVARHGDLVLGVLPMNTAWTVKCVGMGRGMVGERVREVVGALEGRWIWKGLVSAGVWEGRGDVWSRKARRAKKFREEKEGAGDEEEEIPVALAVKVTAKDEELEVRWLRGNDYELFESFCGMLKRAMNSKA